MLCVLYIYEYFEENQQPSKCVMQVDWWIDSEKDSIIPYICHTQLIKPFPNDLFCK